jgi:hypothetical protein
MSVLQVLYLVLRVRARGLNFLHVIRLGGLIWCMTALQGHRSGAPVLGRLRRAAEKKTPTLGPPRET